jgi:hypothetical protein
VQFDAMSPSTMITPIVLKTDRDCNFLMNWMLISYSDNDCKRTVYLPAWQDHGELKGGRGGGGRRTRNSVSSREQFSNHSHPRIASSTRRTSNSVMQLRVCESIVVASLSYSFVWRRCTDRCLPSPSRRCDSQNFLSIASDKLRFVKLSGSYM